MKPNLAPLSYVSYEGYVRLYIAPHLGSKRLDKLDRAGRARVADQAGDRLPVLRPGEGRQAGQPLAGSAARSVTAASRTRPGG